MINTSADVEYVFIQKTILLATRTLGILRHVNLRLIFEKLRQIRAGRAWRGSNALPHVHISFSLFFGGFDPEVSPQMEKVQPGEDNIFLRMSSPKGSLHW